MTMLDGLFPVPPMVSAVNSDAISGTESGKRVVPANVFTHAVTDDQCIVRWSCWQPAVDMKRPGGGIVHNSFVMFTHTFSFS